MTHRTHFRPLVIALAVTLTLAGISSAFAAGAPPPLDRGQRAEVIDSLRAELVRSYVEADTGRMIADHLRKRLASGAYDGLANPSSFAEQVTTDLRRLNGDLHLSLRYDPTGTGSGPINPRGGVRRVVVGPGPAPGAAGGAPGHGPTVVVAGAAGDAAGGDSATLARTPFAREAQRINYGLTRLEILPGNVGYLEITAFAEAPGVDQVIADALRFLERTDAVILDVRRNGGGSGRMSHLLFSHFLEVTPVPTIRVKDRSPEGGFEMQSVADVPGPRRPDVPLYVLTSRRTGSAGEEFSFVLHNLHRATLVGERTAGAGHMVNSFDLPDGFVAGISITRVSDPKTGLEWEGIGVQPDVRVDAERALGVAHAAALRGIAAKTEDDGRRRRLEMLAAWVAAKDQPATIAPERAAAYAGRYEGDRSVSLEAGKLVYRRADMLTITMTPIGESRFSLDGEALIEFAPGAPSPRIVVERMDGSRGEFARVTAKD
jgi:hypothetical protein